MWNSLTRFFSNKSTNQVAAEDSEEFKASNTPPNSSKDLSGSDSNTMDDHLYYRRWQTNGGGPVDNVNDPSGDGTDTRQAKQRASFKWLVAKAYGDGGSGGVPGGGAETNGGSAGGVIHRVAEALREPLYRDHDNAEQPKPQLVHGLANGELYCRALANIYADPNYHNLNHLGVLQALSRKGLPLDMASLTETVLIQTTPLRTAAHIQVIDALMALHAKEVATADRVQIAVRRFGPAAASVIEPSPRDHEQALLLWVRRACIARQITPPEDLFALSDGVALCAVCSIYCPEAMPWSDVEKGSEDSSAPPPLAACLRNAARLEAFCRENLYTGVNMSVMHMRPQDLAGLRPALRPNLVALLADLFNLLEIQPADRAFAALGRSSNAQGVGHRRGPLPPAQVAAIPDLRASLDEPAASTLHTAGFSVPRTQPPVAPLRKSASLPHAASVAPPSALDHHLDDRSSSTSTGGSTPAGAGGGGDSPANFVVHRGRGVPTLHSTMHREEQQAAGRPSNWEEQRRSSYAGRRSRRNSLTEESQLTLENFGGSQEHLHLLGRNPDKEVGHIGRQQPIQQPQPLPAQPVRSSAQDARSTAVEALLAQDDIDIRPALTSKVTQMPASTPQPQPPTLQTAPASPAIKVTTFASKQSTPPVTNTSSAPSSPAPMPVHTTTWQQQRDAHSNTTGLSDEATPEALAEAEAAAAEAQAQAQMTAQQLLNVRLKLEERRRRIEGEKRRQEVAMNRHRQKVGKAAFLQAVTKQGNQPGAGNSIYDGVDNLDGLQQPQQHTPPERTSFTLQHHAHLNNDIAEDLRIHHPIHHHSGQLSSSPPQQISHSTPTHQTIHNSYEDETDRQSMSQFYLHEQPNRRTWAQQAAANQPQSWASEPRYQNGDSSGNGPFTFQLHNTTNNNAIVNDSSPHRRISQLLSDPSANSINSNNIGHSMPVHHAPLPAPSADAMEPQSISFIGEDPGPVASSSPLSEGIRGLHITSGSRTYRIPSPTRPQLRQSIQRQHQQMDINQPPPTITQSPQPLTMTIEDSESKGFYISFDNDNQPKRPKPPLRVKRASPKKEPLSSMQPSSGIGSDPPSRGYSPPRINDYNEPPVVKAPSTILPSSSPSSVPAVSSEPAVGLVIGTGLADPDPLILDEMERKKERIMLLSLQRRQQQEEAKAAKATEAQRRRELDKAKQEARELKKCEERMRRAAILEQYKLKKALEEAEREGKVVDASLASAAAASGYGSLSGGSSTMTTPRMRARGGPGGTGPRPRPKTIHVDSADLPVGHGEGVLSPGSRSKKGSTTNLTDSSLPRYQTTSSSSGGRNRYPSQSGGSGGSGGYHTSATVHLRGRKSNSLMNLSGSSTDQDSYVYRYADTDSGLGRATPPRRAPSPGMGMGAHHGGSLRHLPSPSGPGSLPPGLLTKRRPGDDAASDTSTPSSMMEYTGPRLYKQPATKSNRGIMLNAVEYCVFPGAVNREAKSRVLEEIARSEAKHFLILFRDAGFQFRALYSYCPDREDVHKLYGTGPRQVADRMFDKFFKYNSGGKRFSQVHTKHLTVTIDAFTIHNSLWQGKKVALPNKKDMALVI